jgi:hypothetical protein
MKKNVTSVHCFAASSKKSAQQWAKESPFFDVSEYPLTDEGLQRAKEGLREKADTYLDHVWTQFIKDNESWQ